MSKTLGAKSESDLSRASVASVFRRSLSGAS